MMHGLFRLDGDESGDLGLPSAGSSALGPALEAQSQVKELTRRVERLSILNQALWEILRDKIGLTDEELEGKVQEVDMRDGVADGSMTATAVRCPRCQRVCNARHKKCLYCGQLFEAPLFG